MFQLNSIELKYPPSTATYFAYCKSAWQNPFKIIALFNLRLAFEILSRFKPACVLYVCCVSFRDIIYSECSAAKITELYI